MVETSDIVDRQTLLQHVGDGTILSLWHRVQAEAEKSDCRVDEALKQIRTAYEGGELVVAEDGAKPSVQTCELCGCTADYACANGCTWSTPTICSSCTAAIRRPRPRDEIEAQMVSWIDGDSTSREIELQRLTLEVLLDIRESLGVSAQMSVQTVECLAGVNAQLLELSEVLGEKPSRIITAGAI